MHLTKIQWEQEHQDGGVHEPCTSTAEHGKRRNGHNSSRVRRAKINNSTMLGNTMLSGLNVRANGVRLKELFSKL